MKIRFGSASLRVSVSSLALAAAAGLLIAHPAAAQTATPAQPANATAAPATDQGGGEPIVTVTAERRTVNLQTAPLAATVIAGAKLQEVGINTLDDLQFHTPSLTVTDDGGTVLFNIRGVGKDLTNVQTPSGVVTYWDGVASFPGFFQSAPYYDIANVEVLRGPQGTFAGQNADAGAVFITTNDPHLGGYSGYAEAQYGSYNDWLGRGYVNIPLGDTLAVRVAANVEDRDSFYHVAGPWTTPNGRTPGSYLDESFRVGVLWQPTSAFKAIAKFDYNYIDTSGIPEDPSQVIDLSAPGFERPNPGSLFNVTDYTKTYAVETTYRASLNAAYTFGDGTVLRSISAYQYGWGDADADLTIAGFGTGVAGGPPYLDSFADYGREQIYSEELNLISPDRGPLRWVAGAYYQHDYVTLLPGGSGERGNIGFDIGVPAGAFDEDLAYHTPKQTGAAFGQVSYDLTSALQLQVGARYTYESFGLQDTTFDQSGGVTIPGTAFNYIAHTSDQGVTGKVALNWKLNETNFLYAFVATGSKASGINTNPVGTQTGPVPFKPETVTDYEAGWKPTFFDGHLRAQLGGYFDQYKNFQLSFGVPSSAGNQAFIRNVGGETTLYGLEAELQAVFGPLSFDAGGSYEHSALGSALVDDPGPSATSGQLIQLAGRTVPLAPEWTFNAGAQYAFGLPNDATITPRVDYSYISSQWGTPYQDIGDFLPAHSVVNAEIAYAQGRYKVTFYATNAFNAQYLIGSSGGLRYAGDPAQYGIRLEGKF